MRRSNPALKTHGEHEEEEREMALALGPRATGGRFVFELAYEKTQKGKEKRKQINKGRDGNAKGHIAGSRVYFPIPPKHPRQLGELLVPQHFVTIVR